MTFVDLEIGLKIDPFSLDSGVTLNPGTNLVGGKLVASRALSNINPGSLKPDSRDPETETGKLETEKRVHRIHGTLETGLQKDASQPGGPLNGGQRICVNCGLIKSRCCYWRCQSLTFP